MRSLDFVDDAGKRSDLPPFRVGDTVRVHVKVREGEKERIQIFEGVVLVRRGGGSGATFTVRKISSGVGVERIFPVQSPLVTKVEIKSRGYVRRSRLYYLRDLSGKKARLQSKVRDLSDVLSQDEVDARDQVVEEPIEAEPEVVEEVVETAAEKKLRGKARKKANAKQKAERRAELDAAATKKKKAKAPPEPEASETAEES